MKTFRSIPIKKIIHSTKLIVEVPHQRKAFIYDTSLKMTDFVSENSNNRLRDDLADNSHNFVITNLGELQDAYENTTGHQATTRRWLIKIWSREYLTNAQYLSIFGERKSYGK